MQEAWLPSGSESWERLGISRRGRRPTQQGLYAHSPTEDQAKVRQCFAKCSAAWNALPWDTPAAQWCLNLWGKDYWKKMKDERGVMCSYYDVYMRYCLRHCLATGCIPPANYSLSVEPALTEVECYKVYDLRFGNNCGEVSFVSGEGEFIPPSEWVSPRCGKEGKLCFKDANGSFGFTTYEFAEEYVCDPFTWPASNPKEINPGETKEVFVEGGVPPFTWSISGVGFSLADSVTQVRINSVHNSSGGCGTARIEVIDACGNRCFGFVLSTVGAWVPFCSGTNDSSTCAYRKWYIHYPDLETKVMLGVGCHYHPYHCIYYSCGGYTSYLPEPAGVLKCGTRNWTGGCGDIGSAGCYYYNVWLVVEKWECPP